MVNTMTMPPVPRLPSDTPQEALAKAEAEILYWKERSALQEAQYTRIVERASAVRGAFEALLTVVDHAMPHGTEPKAGG